MTLRIRFSNASNGATMPPFETLLILLDCLLRNLYHLTFPFQLLPFFSFLSLVLIPFLVPSLSLLLLIALFEQEIIPFLYFHSVLPFLVHILFHNHIQIQKKPFLYLFYLFPYQFLSHVVVLYLEVLKHLVYKLLYMPFLLLFLLEYLIHLFYMFLYID